MWLNNLWYERCTSWDFHTSTVGRVYFMHFIVLKLQRCVYYQILFDNNFRQLTYYSTQHSGHSITIYYWFVKN